MTETNVKAPCLSKGVEVTIGVVHREFKDPQTGQVMQVVTCKSCGHKTTILKSQGLEGTCDAVCKFCDGQAV